MVKKQIFSSLDEPKQNNKDFIVKSLLSYMSSITWKMWLPWSLVGVTIIIAGVVTATQLRKTEALQAQLQAGTSSSQLIAQTEVRELVTAVSKLLVLPENEDPTIATVTDPSKLEGQEFFTAAQNGDKVLIYAKAKKAVLYRPSDNKIIEVAPVNIDGSESAEPRVAGSVSEITDKSRISINIKNASNSKDLAQRVAASLKLKGFQSVVLNDVPVGSSDNTSLAYGEQFKSIAPEINKAINNQATAQLQVGSSDITLILGSDFVE